MPSLFELPQNVWREHIVYFFNNEKDLVRLDSAVMSKIVRDTFLANISGCKRFEHFKVDHNNGIVRWCVLRNIIANAVDIVGEVQLVDAIYIPQLFIQMCPNITNVSLVKGITGCVKLKTCFLEECPKIGANSVVALLNFCVNLTDLTLIGTFNLDAVSAHLCTVVNLKSLTTRSSSPSTPAVIRGIATFMPRLHTLRLQHPSDSITDADIDMLVSKCHSLTSFQLFHSNRLTNAAFVFIARQLTQMVSLQLSGCTHVSDAGVITLAKSLVELRTLHLNDLRITDASIQAVGTHCRVLQDLDVTNCWLLTDDAFSKLNVQVLGRLNVSGTQVTGSFAAHIFSNKSSLHCFDCYHCHRLNGSFLHSLLPFNQLLTLRMESVPFSTTDWLKLSTLFPSIRHLEIHNAKDVNDDVARSFYATCTKLRISNFSGCSVSPKNKNM